MTTAFTARRRAEEFDSLLELASAPDLRDTRFTELTEALAALLAAEPVMPRSEFSADLRERLMAEATTVLVASPGRKPVAPQERPRVGRDRKAAAVLGGFAILTAGTSMAVAAQSALPGDTLYPLKRALENVHAGVQSGDGRGTTMLANASDRLTEVDALSRTGSRNPHMISETLHAFATQATAASQVLLSDYQANHHDSSLNALQTFTSDSLQRLQALEQLVPVESRGSLIQADAVIHRILDLATAACPTCTVDTAMSLPRAVTTSLVRSLTDVVDGAALTHPSTPSSAKTAKSHATHATSTDGSSSTHPASPSAPSSTSTQPSNPLKPGTKPPSSAQGSNGKSGDPADPLTQLGNTLTGGSDASGSKGLAGVLNDTVNVLGDLLGGGTN